MASKKLRQGVLAWFGVTRGFEGRLGVCCVLSAG